MSGIVILPSGRTATGSVKSGSRQTRMNSKSSGPIWYLPGATGAIAGATASGTAAATIRAAHSSITYLTDRLLLSRRSLTVSKVHSDEILSRKNRPGDLFHRSIGEGKANHLGRSEQPAGRARHSRDEARRQGVHLSQRRQFGRGWAGESSGRGP